MPAVITVATYNIHKCRGIDGRVSASRIADVIQEVKPDIIALQEVLSQTSASYEAHQARFLAEQLGMYLVRGPTVFFENGEYGNILLSRFPFNFYKNFSLMRRRREQRACLRADITLDGMTVHVFNAHLGTGYFERCCQVRDLFAQIIVTDPALSRAKILLGDFNEWFRGVPSRLLRKELKEVNIRRRMGRPRTFPGFLPLFRLDRIYLGTGMRARHAFVHKSRLARVASDHLPVVAELEIDGSPASHAEAPAPSPYPPQLAPLPA